MIKYTISKIKKMTKKESAKYGFCHAKFLVSIWVAPRSEDSKIAYYCKDIPHAEQQQKEVHKKLTTPPEKYGRHTK